MATYISPLMYPVKARSSFAIPVSVDGGATSNPFAVCSSPRAGAWPCSTRVVSERAPVRSNDLTMHDLAADLLRRCASARRAAVRSRRSRVRQPGRALRRRRRAVRGRAHRVDRRGWLRARITRGLRRAPAGHGHRAARRRALRGTAAVAVRSRQRSDELARRVARDGDRDAGRRVAGDARGRLGRCRHGRRCSSCKVSTMSWRLPSTDASSWIVSVRGRR